MKLSEKQKEVIRAMRKGDGLYYSDEINSRVRMREIKVSSATVIRLEELNLIQRPHYLGSFTLTEKGKTISL